ncbi:TlpA family protein disulfide reductase [Actinoplanes sp. NPDC049599]|uniref:TlpA family protein disulfide reductase n=1 Tax=Actinoplanes sp. NPDC049599 TaxID=3363903 RepID=UPI0037B45DD7
MDTTGLIVVAAVLVLGTVAGLWRRRTDGRFLSVVGSAVSSVPEASGGRGAGEPASGGPGAGDASAAGQRIDPGLLARLGVEPAPATLLQFSSAFCAPCRAVRRVSGEVAGLLPGVRHVEVDAESHLEAVRALGIWRTPTLLVLDAEGRVAKRATGVPAKAQLIAVLGPLLPAAPPA